MREDSVKSEEMMREQAECSMREDFTHNGFPGAVARKRYRRREAQEKMAWQARRRAGVSRCSGERGTLTLQWCR